MKDFNQEHILSSGWTQGSVVWIIENVYGPAKTEDRGLENAHGFVSWFSLSKSSHF